MKKLLLLVAVLSSYIGYSQQYVYDSNDISIAIAEYTLANTDSVSKYTDHTAITAVLNFSKGGALHDIKYYSGVLAEGKGLGNEVTVWPGLDAFIKNQYPFVPDSRYDREIARFDVMTMTLWLDKSKLPSAIKEMERLKKAEAKLLKQMAAERPFIDVQPDAPFTLTVKKLVINNKKLPANEVKGKLMYLDSGAVQLSAECYITFKVLKTSENGFPRNFLEYKLFVIKDGQATLYAKEENRFEIDNGVASLEISGNREYEEEKENVTDEEDYDFGTEEAGTIVSTDTFDFEINITFREP
jgi:hypothetical protein